MPTHVRFLALVLSAVLACQSLGVRENLTPEQMTLIRADSEAFAAIVREENKPPPAGQVVSPGSRWWIDAWPYGEPTPFHEAAGGSTGAGNNSGSFFAPRPDSAMMIRLTKNRKRILAKQGVREGEGFSYPNCGGTLAYRPLPPPSGSAATAGGCPAVVENYLTVGIPVRGQLELLQQINQRRNAKPIDLSGEIWLVVVDRHFASPGGQNWFQSAAVLKRDPATRQLGVVTTILLSWAE